jgi:glycosyltransferase involved in cell wall biosynthesis
MVVNTADQGGGAERFSWLLFKGLERRGVESWLLVGDKRTDDPRVLPLYASPYFDYRAYARWRYRAGLPILRWLERRVGLEGFSYPFSAHILELTGPPPDLVVCVNLHGGYFDLRQLSRLSQRVPLVMRPGDGWLFTGHCACPLECARWLRGCGRCPDLKRPPAVARDATRLNWRRKRHIYRKARVYAAAPSQWQMTRLERSMLMPAVRQRRIIRNGVDQTVFRPGSRLAARQALGLPPEGLLALVVSNLGRENPYKDFATLRAALGLLTQDLGCPAAQILVVGGEAPPESWVAVQVRYLPYCVSPARLALYYQAADLLVHPSVEESSSFVIAEALSCGLPVLANRAGSLPAMVADGETGLLVQSRDPEAMARALRHLLADAALRERLARHAAVRARGSLDVERMVDGYLAWFREICANGATGA